MPIGDRLDSHHMPARQSNPSVHPKYGPAIQMDPHDHYLTNSNGRNGRAGAIQSEVADMITSGNMRGAMAREIRDVRRTSLDGSASRTKDNKAMGRLLYYAKSRGMLYKQGGEMKISKYKSFGPVNFGTSETEVVKQLGNPRNTRTNNENELEYHYDDVIVRYDATSKLVREGTLLPKESGEFQINDMVLDWRDDFLKTLCLADGDPNEFYGYIVLFNLGITLTGFHDGDDPQKAISAFSLGDWDQFKGDMTAFKLW